MAPKLNVLKLSYTLKPLAFGSGGFGFSAKAWRM
jgi:hypothetical protein